MRCSLRTGPLFPVEVARVMGLSQYRCKRDGTGGHRGGHMGQSVVYTHRAGQVGQHGRGLRPGIRLRKRHEAHAPAPLPPFLFRTSSNLYSGQASGRCTELCS